MNILLTNDDGYQANGIIFLKEYFEKKVIMFLLLLLKVKEAELHIQ